MKNQLSVKTVPFMGDELMAAKDEKSGKIYAGVKWICDGVGLSEGQAKSERLRIQNDIVLKQGGRNIILPTKGGNQSVQCIDNDFVPLWLAKITITPTMKKEQPEVANKLVQYQLKAQKVLANAFLHPEKQPTYKNIPLPSFNHLLEINVKQMEDANIEPKRRAVWVNSITNKVLSSFGFDVPMPTAECEKTYDKEQIAKTLGVYSKSGKPHSQAIAAIIRTLNIGSELVEHSPFAANGHSDDYDRYKAPVLDMVQSWITVHNKPSTVVLDKSYNVVYR